jgi:hypothetical protein
MKRVIHRPGLYTGGGPLEAGPPPAPIRTTSPGLTVYRGGAFTPRYIYMRQQLGGLKVDRHIMLLDFSYTPTPKLLVEAEIPVTRISFKGGATSGGTLPARRVPDGARVAHQY